MLGFNTLEIYIRVVWLARKWQEFMVINVFDAGYAILKKWREFPIPQNHENFTRYDMWES